MFPARFAFPGPPPVPVKSPSVVAASRSCHALGAGGEDALGIPIRGRRIQLTVQVADLAVLDCWKVTSKWWGPG